MTCLEAISIHSVKCNIVVLPPGWEQLLSILRNACRNESFPSQVPISAHSAYCSTYISPVFLSHFSPECLLMVIPFAPTRSVVTETTIPGCLLHGPTFSRWKAVKADSGRLSRSKVKLGNELSSYWQLSFEHKGFSDMWWLEIPWIFWRPLS